MIKPYDRERAVAYAHRWALGRNPAYADFENMGGDCTNFASQVLFAGSGIMDFGQGTGWYYVNAYNRTPSWTGVEFLYNYLTAGGSHTGPFAVNTGADSMEPGDLVQLSFEAGHFGHTPVIIAAGYPASVENIMVAAHTDNVDYYPLTSYNWVGIRFLHIAGVRL